MIVKSYLAAILFGLAAVGCGGASSGPGTATPIGGVSDGGVVAQQDAAPVQQTPAGDGGTTTSGAKTGCNGSLACFQKSTTDATDKMCADNSTPKALMLLDGIFSAVFDWCEGKGTGAPAARCKEDAQGKITNAADGAAPYDAQGKALNACGKCLDNAFTIVNGDPCTPAGDPDCKAAPVTAALNTCKADKP